MRTGNWCKKHFPVLTILLILVYSTTALADNHPVNQSGTLTLTPGSKVYTLNQASMGKVHFMAEIKNTTEDVLVIAHPLTTYPEGYKHGDEFPSASRHGFSEILLNITQPNGEVVMLREGGSKYFEPGNLDYFFILPKSSKSFYVGWFFQNSKGRWEDDTQAWKAFAQKGTYEIYMVYRNFLPLAAVRTNPMEKAEFIKPWNGEIISETITVEVK